MTDSPVINEDDRRKLTAFPEGKMLEIKQDCIVGGHYHKIKTEYFVLTQGKCLLTIIHGVESLTQMEIGKLYKILPFEFHSFNIKAGSVLIGLCSHPYDHQDDYYI